jgi:hypothetical protein
VVQGSQPGLAGLFDSYILPCAGSSQPVLLPPDLQNSSAILVESLHDTDGAPSPLPRHMQQHRADGEGDQLLTGGRLVHPGGLLACLFAFAVPGALEEMLEEVLVKGVAWRSVIRVPVNLQNAAAAVSRVSEQEQGGEQGRNASLADPAGDSTTPPPAPALHDSQSGTQERSSVDDTTAILSTIPDRTSLLSPKAASTLAGARISDAPSLGQRPSRTSGPGSKLTAAGGTQPTEGPAGVLGSPHHGPPAALRRISLSATARGSEPGLGDRPSGFRKVPSAGALALMDPSQGAVTALAAAAQAAAGLMVQVQAAAGSTPVKESTGVGSRPSLSHSIDSNRSSFNRESQKDAVTNLLGRQSFNLAGGAQTEGGARNQLKTLSSMPRHHGTSLAGAPPRPPQRQGYHLDTGPGSASGVLGHSPRQLSHFFSTGPKPMSGTSPQIPSPQLGLGSQEDTRQHQHQGQQLASPPTKPGPGTATDAPSVHGTGGAVPSSVRESRDGREVPPRRVLSWQDAEAQVGGPDGAAEYVLSFMQLHALG